jgi:hypothetical protein
MENRRKLRESGLVLIIFGVLNLFMFMATVVQSIVDGTVAKALAGAEADILLPVQIMLVVIATVLALLVAADILLGVKAVKVSKNPTAGKGYIIVAGIFLALSLISTVSHITALFLDNPSLIDAILNVLSSALNVVVYLLFINAAVAVRKDVLNKNG